MTRIERREDALRRIQQKKAAVASKEMEDSMDVSGQPHCIRLKSCYSSSMKDLAKMKAVKSCLTFAESEALPYTPPALHHHISDSQSSPANITSFLASFQGDPAIFVCF
jgi:hypothetical protein